MDTAPSPEILIVDDIPDNVELVARFLRGRDYQISFASSGPEALTHLELQIPDLILLDVNMPGMNGFEVCRHLQGRPELKSVPVIFVTARTSSEDLAEGFAAGGVDYITKPLKRTELLSRVGFHLELKRTREALAQQNQELQSLNQALTGTVTLLQRQTAELSTLNLMNDRLQRCASMAQARRELITTLPTLFREEEGVLVLTTGDETPSVTQWSKKLDQPPPQMGLCQAMAAGPGLPASLSGLPSCPCQRNHGNRPYLCLPLGHDRAFQGVLRLRFPENDPDRQLLARAVVRTIDLTLGNLQLQEELRQQAIRDPLTGLYNRRHMEAALAREIHRSLRKGGHLAVILLDLDHFKDFKDAHGSQAGNALLQTVGAALTQRVRAGDVACRCGGEEFLLILPDTDTDSALKRAETLRQAVTDLGKDHPEDRVTCSVGVALLPLHGDTPDGLIRAADQALHQAKRCGHDRVEMSHG